MAKKDLMANLKKDTRSMGAAPDPVETVAAPTKPKKKIGRPKVKTEPEKTINIAIPISTLEKMDVAKVKYGNNLTRYVNAIINADLEANYDKYLEIQKILNS